VTRGGGGPVGRNDLSVLEEQITIHE
jgi:hypothetical protein